MYIKNNLLDDIIIALQPVIKNGHVFRSHEVELHKIFNIDQINK